MSHHRHHHHPEHRLVDREETTRRIDRRRQQGLAWFGVVIVLAILAFCGIAVWSGYSDNGAIVPQNPVETPVQVNPDVPGDVTPTHPVDPVINQHRGGGDHHRVNRKPRRHHPRRGHVSGGGDNGDGHGTFCNEPKVIPAYAHDGSVVEIPNPDCK